MKYVFTSRFNKLKDNLPEEVSQHCLDKLRMWQDNPHHPSLKFKKVADNKPLWSLRVNLQIRLLGYRKNDTVIWDWIGSHDEYIRTIKRLQ